MYLEKRKRLGKTEIKRIKYADRMSNENVSVNVKESRALLNKILKRKGSWMGRIVRGNEITTGFS